MTATPSLEDSAGEWDRVCGLHDAIDSSVLEVVYLLTSCAASMVSMTSFNWCVVGTSLPQALPLHPPPHFMPPPTCPLPLRQRGCHCFSCHSSRRMWWLGSSPASPSSTHQHSSEHHSGLDSHRTRPSHNLLGRCGSVNCIV